jgi:hypothetical protein
MCRSLADGGVLGGVWLGMCNAQQAVGERISDEASVAGASFLMTSDFEPLRKPFPRKLWSR